MKARPGSAPGSSAQQRHLPHARAAYFVGVKRGVAPGGEAHGWIEADAKVLRLIGKA